MMAVGGEESGGFAKWTFSLVCTIWRRQTGQVIRIYNWWYLLTRRGREPVTRRAGNRVWTGKSFASCRCEVAEGENIGARPPSDAIASALNRTRVKGRGGRRRLPPPSSCARPVVTCKRVAVVRAVLPLVQYLRAL